MSCHIILHEHLCPEVMIVHVCMQAKIAALEPRSVLSTMLDALALGLEPSPGLLQVCDDGGDKLLPSLAVPRSLRLHNATDETEEVPGSPSNTHCMLHCIWDICMLYAKVPFVLEFDGLELLPTVPVPFLFPSHCGVPLTAAAGICPPRVCGPSHL
jgi:hypothetical protein